MYKMPELQGVQVPGRLHQLQGEPEVKVILNGLLLDVKKKK
jgi:hypothetical protein